MIKNDYILPTRSNTVISTAFFTFGLGKAHHQGSVRAQTTADMRGVGRDRRLLQNSVWSKATARTHLLTKYTHTAGLPAS